MERSRHMHANQQNNPQILTFTSVGKRCNHLFFSRHVWFALLSTLLSRAVARIEGHRGINSLLGAFPEIISWYNKTEDANIPDQNHLAPNLRYPMRRPEKSWTNLIEQSGSSPIHPPVGKTPIRAEPSESKQRPSNSETWPSTMPGVQSRISCKTSIKKAALAAL